LPRRSASRWPSRRSDLDNYSEQAAEQLVAAAFSEPLPAPHALRVTLICGGGKSVRGRYDPGLVRGLTQALKALGFEDDPGAAIGATRAFKHQQDTGRNLKYVHVFPEVSAKAGGDEEEAAEAAVLDAESPEYQLVAAEDLDAFAALCEARLHTYAQRLRAAKALGGTYAPLLAAVEGKMAKGQALTPDEEAWAAITSHDALQERVAWLQASMRRMVEDKRLTAADRALVLSAAESKLAALAEELAKAEADGKGKRVEKLRAQEAQLRATADAAREVSTVQAPGDQALAKALEGLWQDLLRARQLEASSKGPAGTLLSLEQAQVVGRIPDLEAAIAAAKERARRWFEADAELDARTAGARDSAAAALKRRSAAAAAKGGGGGGWSSVGGSKSKGGATGAKTGGKGGGGSRGGFAMLGDVDL